MCTHLIPLEKFLAILQRFRDFYRTELYCGWVDHSLASGVARRLLLLSASLRTQRCRRSHGGALFCLIHLMPFYVLISLSTHSIKAIHFPLLTGHRALRSPFPRHSESRYCWCITLRRVLVPTKKNLYSRFLSLSSLLLLLCTRYNKFNAINTCTCCFRLLPRKMPMTVTKIGNNH